jgi:transcriptional regulator with XRE-family HTH domain
MAPRTTAAHGSGMAGLHELLRRRRLDLDEGQAEFARRFNVTQTTVSRWERGKGLRVDKLHQMADVLELSFEEVVAAYGRTTGEDPSSVSFDGDPDGTLTALTQQLLEWRRHQEAEMQALRDEVRAQRDMLQAALEAVGAAASPQTAAGSARTSRVRKQASRSGSATPATPPEAPGAAPKRRSLAKQSGR